MKTMIGQCLVVGMLTLLLAILFRSIPSERESLSLAAVPSRQDFGFDAPQETGVPQPSPSLTDSRPGLPQGGSDSDNGETFDESGMTRVREGKRIKDPTASFQIVGERVHCVLNQHNLTVVVLENLTLERVHHYLLRGGDNPTWEVEGVITEYEGSNFLLLHRAIVNSLELDE